MHFNCKPGHLATVALLCTLSLAGCNSGAHPNTQPANSQPAAGQPAGSQPAQSAQNQPPAADAPASSAAPSTSAAAPPPAVIDLPAGTRLRVRLDEDLGSKISQPGQSFKATIAEEVTVNGQTVIARGARAEGTVVDAKPLGRFKGGALLQLRLERVRSQWGSYPVATSSIERAEKGKGQRTAGFIGGGAGFGALVGGLAGGGKGAAIGALAGGGAGTAGSAFTGNKQIFLPAETLLTFRLQHAVHITMQN
jgi:hypothetical protein